MRPNKRIGKACNIGQNVFIAAAVVTKEVPDYALIVRNPGRIAGWMSEYGERMEFDAENRALCEYTGSVYVLEGGIVKKGE